MPETPNLQENQIMTPPSSTRKRPENYAKYVISELKIQQKIAAPLVVMNLTWFIKITITTAFLGRLGELPLAGGALGFTFGNVTGFAVLMGLCGAMEPICGQAYGAKNFKLLHKTLLMVILLLLLAAVPISFVWLNVDKILICFGQQKEISFVVKKYLFYLLPALVVTSFLYPLRSYLSSQSIIVPIMVSSAVALVCHVPINILLSGAKGLEGVAMAVWISDLIIVIQLAVYVIVSENREGGKWKEGGWWDQRFGDWKKLLKLSAPCCLTTCLEWWCSEILILLTGRLKNPKQVVGIITIVMNFDYLLYAVMISLATCASTRVSNELGANRAGPARHAAYVSLAVCVISGVIGSLLTVAAREGWGSLFSHNKEIIRGVKKMMLLMALGELMNFPLIVCGGIVRGTARPWLALYANLAGFYLLALPVGLVLAFKLALGLAGLLGGFLTGVAFCLVLLLVFVSRINWDKEAGNAQVLTEVVGRHASGSEVGDDANGKTSETTDNGQV